MIVLNKGLVHLDGSTIMLIAEMITAINGVQEWLVQYGS